MLVEEIIIGQRQHVDSDSDSDSATTTTKVLELVLDINMGDVFSTGPDDLNFYHQLSLSLSLPLPLPLQSESESEPTRAIKSTKPNQSNPIQTKESSVSTYQELREMLVGNIS